MKQHIINSLQEAQDCLSQFLADATHADTIARMVETMSQCFQAGGKVISCGNGGSMCDAMHFAEELSARFRHDRAGLPALAISDAAHLTCVANDFGYEYVFSRYVEALGQAGDVLLVFSTSGNSMNVVRAAEQARQKKMSVIALLGKAGGKLKPLADLYLIAPGQHSDRIQEIHEKVMHVLIEMIERKLFPRLY